ncbi:hypothetical protein [Sphingomonas sp. GB1N7]|uniref:hypothetical protein n=1 Tax=Parasphingomonas caseinilytica TaxID=3096158 RepID=UPI002FCB9D8E
MKRTGLAFALACLAAVSVQAAPPVAPPTPTPTSMSVRTFLAKVAKLKGLGPLALASSDLTQVKEAARSAGLALKADSDAREAAGKPPLACPPKGTKMGGGEFLAALESIPAAERDMPLKQGFARVLVSRYPCAKKA